MSSVLIRGIEMPEECNACPLANYNMGTMYCKALPPSPKGYHVIRFEGKREDCPLVEIPPHGRLIDATFEENHYGSMLLNPTPDVTEQDKHKARIVIDALRMAGTVIEAEGSEE